MIGKERNWGNLRRIHRVVGMPDGGTNGMERRVLRITSPEASSRARLALAARLHRPSRPAPLSEPETIMAISFEGLTEREQEAALAAFPGGKRFVLAN